MIFLNLKYKIKIQFKYLCFQNTYDWFQNYFLIVQKYKIIWKRIDYATVIGKKPDFQLRTKKRTFVILCCFYDIIITFTKKSSIIVLKSVILCFSKLNNVFRKSDIEKNKNSIKQLKDFFFCVDNLVA